jgi:hypothetical protein
MTEAERRCPTHSQPGADILDAWACPPDCLEFLDELERRLEDVKIHGNFTRLHTDDDGVRWKQVYRNHQPVGEPEPWLKKDRDGEAPSM